MSDTYFRQKSLILARQLYPSLDGDALINEANRIHSYISSHNYQNFIGLNMLADNAVGFAEMLFLQNGDRLKPFVPRGFQREALLRWETGADEIVIHSRRVGMSTTLAIYALWIACYRSDVNMGFIVTNHRQISELIQLMVSLHATAAVSLPKLNHYTSSSLIFENGNRIKMLTPSTLVVGSSLSHVLTDSSAAIALADDENFYSTLMFANRGQMIITGAPGPNFGIFYELATSNTLMATSAVTVTWNENPEFDSTWEAVNRAAMGPKMFANHYECEFLQIKS